MAEERNPRPHWWHHHHQRFGLEVKDDLLTHEWQTVKNVLTSHEKAPLTLHTVR